MAKSESEMLNRLAWPIYFVVLLLIALPVLDYATNMWPIRLGDVDWRYGAVGLLSAYLLTPLVGIVLLLGVAIGLQHRRIVRILSVVNIVVALLIAFAVVFYALDMLQLRGGVPDEARPRFDVGAAKATVKHVAVAMGLAWLGFVGARASRRGKKGGQRHSSSGGMPLVRSEGTTPKSQA
jgi:hypothetical protein